MSTRIIVWTSPNPSAQGSAVLEAAHGVFEIQAKLNRLKGAVDRMSYGADNQAVADELGIPLAKVPDFLSLLTSAVAAINASILTEFAERLDQG